MAVWLSDAQRAANGPLSRAQIAERRLKVHLGHGISPTLPGRGAWLTAGQDLAGNAGNRCKSGTGPHAVDSGDDVGGELVFDLDDAIPQMQLAFLQRCTCNRSNPGAFCSASMATSRSRCSCRNCALRPQFAIAFLLHRCCRTNSLMVHAGGGPGRGQNLKSKQTLEFPSLSRLTRTAGQLRLNA